MYDLYYEIEAAIEALKNGQLEESDRREVFLENIADLKDYAQRLRDIGYDEATIIWLIFKRRQNLTKQYYDNEPTLIKKFMEDVFKKEKYFLTMSFDEFLADNTLEDIKKFLYSIPESADHWVDLDSFMPWLEDKLTQKAF